MKTGPKGAKRCSKILLPCKHTHIEEHSCNLHRQRMTENISLQCTVLARDRFYRILLEHLKAKLKVVELIITNTEHKRILQKTLIQIEIQKLTWDQIKQNVSHIATKRATRLGRGLHISQ